MSCRQRESLKSALRAAESSKGSLACEGIAVDGEAAAVIAVVVDGARQSVPTRANRHPLTNGVARPNDTWALADVKVARAKAITTGNRLRRPIRGHCFKARRRVSCNVLHDWRRPIIFFDIPRSDFLLFEYLVMSFDKC